MPQLPALDWSDIPFEQQQEAYTLGLAYAAKNDQAKLVLDQINVLKKQTGGEARASSPNWKGWVLARGRSARRSISSPRRLPCGPRLWPCHPAARNFGFAPNRRRGRPSPKTAIKCPPWLPR